MAVFNLFKMLALLLISLVAMTSASPIAASTGVSTAGLNCPACVTSIGKVCKDKKLSEYKCDTLWCLSLVSLHPPSCLHWRDELSWAKAGSNNM